MKNIREALLPWSEGPALAKGLRDLQVKLEIKCAQMDEGKQMDNLRLEKLIACLNKWKKLLEDQEETGKSAGAPS
jgi:hypothetical protein